MKNIKLLVVLATLLMIANCVLLGVLWYRSNYKKRAQPRPQPQGQAFEYLTRELKLTPDQVKKYDVLRNQHMQLTRKTSEEMRLQRDSFFDNLKNPNANPTVVKQLEKRILMNQAKLDSATFFHFRNFRVMLNPKQASRFDSIINTALHMMSHPAGRPGDRPGLNGPPAGEPGNKPLNGPRRSDDRRPGKMGPGDRRMGPPPGSLDSNGRPMGPPPERIGPDGRPMPPPGRRGPDGRPMGPPPGEGPPPGYD